MIVKITMTQENMDDIVLYFDGFGQRLWSLIGEYANGGWRIEIKTVKLNEA